MLKTFYLPTFTIKKLPPLFFFSVGCLLGLLLTAYVLNSRYAQQNAHLISNYVSALADLGAAEASDSVLNHDLVSLHAVLQDLREQPRVVLATVYDVEGQLLVQAGEVVYGQPLVSHTKEITLHDSVAGELTVHVTSGFAGDNAVFWVFSGMACLLAFLAGLALYESRGSAWRLKVYQLRSGSEKEDKPGPSAADKAIPIVAPEFLADDAEALAKIEDLSLDEPVSVTFAQVELTLVLQNAQRLKKQLNKAKYQSLQSSFAEYLDRVMTLYGGIIIDDPSLAEEGMFCMRFSSLDGPADVTFKALCAAHLLRALSEEGSLYFNVIAYVALPDTILFPEMTVPGVFIYGQQSYAEVKDKVDVMPFGEGVYRLAGFADSVSHLVAQQLEQLKPASV